MAKDADPLEHRRWQRSRPAFIGLIAVAALTPWPLLITHDNWWAFILATAAIVAALRLLLGRRWASYAGLNLPPTHVLLAVVAFAAVATASQMFLPHLYEAAGLRADAPNLEGQIGFVFQAFNEEIFFRALMIGLLIHYVRSAPAISLGLALLFAAAHFLLYRYSNPMHLALSLNALATLFLAGVAMNNFYLAFRHIGFSWALHAGWNVVWLPATFYDAATHARLHEPQIFDRVLGAPTMIVLAGAMAVLSFVVLLRRPSTFAASI
jgi:membrane protease YdiL (CAAX protease family)